MGFHTFDAANADRLENAERRYRYTSREELIAAIDPKPTATVADLGSGTGFFTDDISPFVKMVYAVDIQPEMHTYYKEKGAPENVEFVTSDISDLPFEPDTLDAAFSTMTYHEFATPAALATLFTVLKPGGRLVTIDWAKDGDGEAGPPRAERFSMQDAIEALTDAGFEITMQSNRPETFFIVATKP